MMMGCGDARREEEAGDGTKACWSQYDLGSRA